MAPIEDLATHSSISCWDNPMEREVHGASKCRTWLRRLCMHTVRQSFRSIHSEIRQMRWHAARDTWNYQYRAEATLALTTTSDKTLFNNKVFWPRRHSQKTRLKNKITLIPSSLENSICTRLCPSRRPQRGSLHTPFFWMKKHHVSGRQEGGGRVCGIGK